MAAKAPTKQELQDLIDEVGTRVTDMLNPALTREQIVEQLQEMDELVNGSDDDEDEEEDEDEDEDDE